MHEDTWCNMAQLTRKIYFAGSIRAGRNDAELYSKIVGVLKKYGCVLTEHVGDPNMTESGDKTLTEKQIHDRDMQWLTESDVLVAEVTQPSLGVGYELGRALMMKKRILCLYRPQTEKRLSAMIRGADGMKVIDYKEEEVESLLQEYFSN